MARRNAASRSIQTPHAGGCDSRFARLDYLFYDSDVISVEVGHHLSITMISPPATVPGNSAAFL